MQVLRINFFCCVIKSSQQPSECFQLSIFTEKLCKINKNTAGNNQIRIIRIFILLAPTILNGEKNDLFCFCYRSGVKSRLVTRR